MSGEYLANVMPNVNHNANPHCNFPYSCRSEDSLVELPSRLLQIGAAGQPGKNRTRQRYFSATVRRREGLRRPHDALKSPLCSPAVQQIRGRIQNTRRHARENTKAKRAANFIEGAEAPQNP